MKKYRAKPVIIDAIQWTNNDEEIRQFYPGIGCERGNDTVLRFIIHTLEGDLYLSRGDWLIKGILGEFYPCKPDVFNRKYEILPADYCEGEENE